MGDRSNIFIIQGRHDDGTAHGIGLYSHWGGTTLHDTALAALASPEAQGRINDEIYLARIVIHKCLAAMADPDSPTGFGLWTDEQMGDNQYPILVIDARDGSHGYCDESTYLTFQPTAETSLVTATPE